MSASRCPETTAIASLRVMSRCLGKVGCSVGMGRLLTAKSGSWRKLLQLYCGEAVIIYEPLKEITARQGTGDSLCHVRLPENAKENDTFLE